jgi:hypothetical protein
MDTLFVTMDVYFAAIDGHYAAKDGLFAMKEGAITAKCWSFVRMAGLFAVKCMDGERTRVSFAVIRRDHAAIRGHNTAKELSFAAIREHHAAMGASNAAMEALIIAKCAFIAAT